MSATRSNHEFDDELLSAYVDNELTAAERAAVEERLRTDDQARQLVAELRAASDAVRALPRKTLGPDFAASILQEIERRHPQSDSTAAAASVATLPPTESRRSGARGMAYAMFAVAAALLVMVVMHGEDRPNEGQVAQSGPPPRIGADPAAVEKTESRRDEFGDASRVEPARAAAESSVRDERTRGAEALGRAASEDRAQSQAARPDSVLATAPVPSAPVPPPAAPAGDAAAPPTAVAEAGAAPAAAQPATMAAADSTPLAAAGVDADDTATRDQAVELEASDALAVDEAKRQPGKPNITTYEYAVASDQDVAQLESLLAASGIAIVDGAPPAELPADAATLQADARTAARAPGDRDAPTDAYLVDATPAQLQTLIAALNANAGKLRAADGGELDATLADGSATDRARRGGFGGGGFGGGAGGGFGGARGGGGGGPARQVVAGRAWRLSTLAKESVKQLADRELQAATPGAAVDGDANADAAPRGGRGGRNSAAAELAEEAGPARALILLRRQPNIVPAEAQP